MGQLCCFPFSRGEEKISKCAALAAAAAGRELREHSCGVLPSEKLTDCFLEKGLRKMKQYFHQVDEDFFLTVKSDQV